MITFTSKTANKEELKKAIWEELIKCTMDAVGPIYGDYEGTGFDYSECKSDTDKRRKFAISFLEEWTDTNLEIIDDGVVLNEDLHTENTCNDGSYDLKALANAIKNKFPDVIIQGEGMIDYHYSAEEYSIYTEDGVIVYEGDGDEGFEEYDEDDEEYDEEEDSVEEEDKTFEYFSNIPHISCNVDVLQYFADKETGEETKDVFDFEILPMAVDIGELSMCAMWSNSDEIVSFAMNKGFSEEYSVFLVCSALFDIADPISISGVRLSDGNVAHATRMQSLLSSLYPILLGIKGINKMLLEENAYDKYLSTDKENCVFRLKLTDGKCSYEIVDKESLSDESNECEEECEVTENDIFSISGDVLTRYNGQESYVEIPYGVKQIGDGASMTFFMAPAKEIVVPNTVVTIAGYAFFRCNALEKILLPQSISTIENHAFRECSNLKTIEFPDEVAVIDREACWGCVSLKEIKLPANLKTIEEKAFSGCISVSSIELPEGLERIEDGVFWGDAAMEKITIPASVTFIGEMAFCDCDNLTIYTPAGSFAEKYAKDNNINCINL